MPRAVLGDEKIARYLDTLATEGPIQAAKPLGMTSTAARRLIRRDETLCALYDQALAEWKGARPDRINDEAIDRSLNGSDTLMKVMLASYVPEHAHLRRDRRTVTHEGRVEHGLTIVLDISALEGRSPEEIARVRGALETLRELGVGDVIDADVGT